MTPHDRAVVALIVGALRRRELAQTPGERRRANTRVRALTDGVDHALVDEALRIVYAGGVR